MLMNLPPWMRSHPFFVFLFTIVPGPSVKRLGPSSAVLVDELQYMFKVRNKCICVVHADLGALGTGEFSYPRYL